MTRSALVSLAAIFLAAPSVAPVHAREGDAPASKRRWSISVNDEAGNLSAEVEEENVVSVSIDGKSVPTDRLEKKGDQWLVRDESGAVVLELSASKEGGVRFRPVRPRVMVGLTMGDVDEALGTQLALDRSAAVLITDIMAGGPAEGAGLRRFDVVTAVDGRAPATRQAIQDAVAAKKPGDPLTLEVRRGSLTLTIAVKTEMAPIALRSSLTIPYLEKFPVLDQLFMPDVGSVHRTVTFDLPAVDRAWRGLDFFPPAVEMRIPNRTDGAAPEPATTTGPSGSSAADVDGRLRAIEERLQAIEKLLQDLAARKPV